MATSKFCSESEQKSMKMKLYEGNKQYYRKADQWKVINTTMLEIEPAEINKITKSMDNSLLAIFEKSHYIEMWRI